MKTKPNFTETLQYIALSRTIISIGLILFIRFSPYKKLSNNRSGVESSIEINKPVHEVFEFMCNVNDVAQWMLYIDHIDVLSKNNSSNENGKYLRYFSNMDETGQSFDARVFVSQRNKKRLLKIFNFNDFPLGFNDLINEQQYSSINKNRCRLNMSLYYKNAKPDFWDEMKAHIVSYRIKMAMHENLENIKNKIENIKPETKF